MDNFIDIYKLLKPFRRWWWILILTVPLATLVGYAFSLGQTRIYQATTTLNVGEYLKASQVNREDILTREVLVKAYADMSTRQPVLQGVIDTLGLEIGWKQLRKNVSINVTENNQLIEITTEANSPEEAEALAEALSKQLLLLSPAGAQNQLGNETRQFIAQQLINLQTKIDDGQGRLEDLVMAVAQDGLSTEKASEIQAEISQLETLINDWTKSYIQLLAYAGSEKLQNRLSIIEPAQANRNPVRPRVQLNLLLSAGLGLILGVSIIFILGMLDRTIRSGDDLREVLGLSPLSFVQEIQGEDYPDKLLVVQAPLSPILESFRVLRNHIELMGNRQRGSERMNEGTPNGTWVAEFHSHPSQVNSIAITSPSKGEGKSIIAANLAISMAQADLKTILIDANLRQPQQHNIFKITNSKGMAEYLRSPDKDPGELLKNTKVKNLRVLTSGSHQGGAIDYVSSQRIMTLLTALRVMADVIIIDSPSIVNYPESALLTNQVDGSLLVIEVGKTTHDFARKAVSELEFAKAHLLGVVLNRIPPESQGRGIKDKLRRAAQVKPPSLEALRRMWKWLPSLK